MFSLPLRDGSRLAPLELWHAEEFADHLDRAREHIRPWVGAAFVTEDAATGRGPRSSGTRPDRPRTAAACTASGGTASWSAA